MLQAMHDRSGKIFTWIIISLLIMGFIFWQIGDYFGIGDPPTAIEVNDDVITENEWRDQYNQIVARMGSQPKGEQDKELRDALTQQLILSSSIYQYAKKIGYHVSDQYLDYKIQSIPAFQEKGKFNPEYLNRYLARVGYSYKVFRQEFAKDIYRQQFEDAIARTEFITEQELNGLLATEHRKIDVQYVKVNASSFKPEVKYKDFDLKEYYQKTRALYQVPEKLKIAYVQIKLADVEKEIKINEAELKKYYETNKSAYRTAPIRKAAHIWLKLEQDAKQPDIDKVMQKAQKIYAELKKTGQFTQLAKKYSDDKFSPNGDLGVIDSKVNPKLYKAVESLKVGEISEPVRSDSGVHILKVTLAKPGSIKTYEQVKSEIEATVKKKKAQKEFVARSERLNDLAIENAESLDSAAETLGLKIQVSDWIYRDLSKNTGVGKYKKIVDTAYNNRDVFADGDAEASVNSYLIELDRGKTETSSIVVRLKKYEAKSIKPYDQVKDDVKKNYINAEIAKRAKEKAHSLLEQVKAGKTLQKVAVANQLKVLKIKEMSRGMLKQSKEFVKAAFKLGLPANDKLLADVVSLKNGDSILLQVLSSKSANKKEVDNKLKLIYRQVQEQQTARDLLLSVSEYIKSLSEIKINSKIIYQTNEN